jgi:hypothetical protein
MKRAASAMDRVLDLTGALSGQRILLAASAVAVADKERAMNLLIAERDNLQAAYETVKNQRDELLKEALDHATPSSAAISVRDALARLRDLQPKLPEAEDLPDVPSTSDDND